MNTEAIVSEILEKIRLWSKGNPNSRIFRAMIKSLTGKTKIYFITHAESMFLYPMPRRKEGYMLWQGALEGMTVLEFLPKCQTGRRDWQKGLKISDQETLRIFSFDNFALRNS